MRNYFLLLPVWLFTAGLLCAQPAYREVLDGLATATPGSSVALPDAFFAQADSTPEGRLQRGLVLYAAAGRARELNNRERSPELITAAKGRLHAAAGTLSGTQKARAYYTLGQIAERYEGNLALAESAYQKAIESASYQQAQQALVRVQRLRNP